MLKDASPYNAMARLEARLRRRGLVRAAARGRALGQLPAVLHARPLSPAAQAYKDVPFQPWLALPEGIEPAQMRALLGFRDRFRRGILTNVVLHARLEGRYADREVKSDLKKAGFHAELIRANARKLRSSWSGCAGSRADRVVRLRAAIPVRRRRRRQGSVRAGRPGAGGGGFFWDLGCNDGRYTRIAAVEADYTVAVDADAAVVEAFYRALRAEGSTILLPIGNVADPSPGLGWRGEERRPLADRSPPDLTLCLALSTMSRLTDNVPVRAFLDWLADLGRRR